MTRKRLREELAWAAADAVAVLLCVALLPLVLFMAVVEQLRGAH